MSVLGVTKNAKGFTASVYAPGAKNCRIRLFKHDEAVPFETVPMSREQNAKDIFSCTFTTSAEEYDFETDAKVFNDPYALQMTARDFCVKGGRRAVFVKNKAIAADSQHGFIDYSDLIIYKLHVRGFTVHESSGVKNPGTFKGVMQKLPYLKSLGINAVLLMPCYDFEENMPGEYGHPAKCNYWGYGAQAQYFAPKAAYAAEPAKVRQEFASMVTLMHKNGIEVLMEMDFAFGTPDMVMLEAIRFWHDVYHVDGFRLMSGNIIPRLIATDPYLKGVKFIGSRWSDECTLDFTAKDRPVLAECNEGYMFDVRRFLRGDEGQVRSFTDRLKENGDRTAKVNYITDHDSFTLADLYSYDMKHNEANGEKNADGREVNYSLNCGAEGPTGIRKVLQLRRRMMKNALTVLLLSQGTPMLMAGDEFGCTHEGNNNPYCCDNEQGWVVWEKGTTAAELTAFTKKLIRLRREHRVFSNMIVLRGTDYIYSGCPDISFHGTGAWYPDYGYFSKTVGMFLNGEYARINRTEPDSSFYVAFNMSRKEQSFGLPLTGKGSFELLFSTDRAASYDGGKTCTMNSGSIAVFLEKRPTE